MKYPIFNSVYQHQGGFGYDSTDQVKNTIAQLDQVYDLVLIQDYFEESLILLRDLLCWTNEDIMVFTINKRKRTQVEKLDNLNSILLNNLKLLQFADVMLYDYFLAKHKQAVVKYGTRKMANEVIKYKTQRDFYLKTCVAETTNELNHEKFPSKYFERRDLNGYLPKKKASLFCQQLTLDYHLLNMATRKYQKVLLS